MNRSKSPPVNLEKYLEGKRHRFCTYAQGARLYAMVYRSFVTMAKQAGANIKLRKTALVDLDILDDYIENECKHNCNLVRLDFQQEQGLVSTLPLAHNEVDIQRGMTTSSTAIFVPFTTQELFQDHRGALYYGLNALSNNLIMVDRKVWCYNRLDIKGSST